MTKDDSNTDVPLPCPFCGGQPDLGLQPVLDKWFVECKGCNTAGDLYESREAATKRWNTRHSSSLVGPSAADFDDYVNWLTGEAATADEWAKKNAEWPDSFDSGHYQAQWQAFTAARVRFLSTFKQKGRVIRVDEAGMLDVRQVSQVLDLADRIGARGKHPEEAEQRCQKATATAKAGLEAAGVKYDE